MTKIMLVEDDKSLREIYGVRLLAEGYDIVSAGDGEEALAIAIKERPSLIISDVMMPKVSGYDMLDILRSTTETKDIKVIMMTALSSEEQRKRGESLGADRYLVKSQVGIEDVVHVVHDILSDNTTPAPAATIPPITTAPQPVAPVSAVPTPVTMPSPVAPPTPPIATPVSPVVTSQPAPTPSPRPEPLPTPPIATPKPASLKDRVIQPINDPTVQTVNMQELLDKEIAKEAGITADALPPIATADQEKAMLNDQLASFQPQPGLDMPTPNISTPPVTPDTSVQTPPPQPPITPPQV